MKIAGSQVIVAGGSSGLGAAVAERLSDLDAQVLVADIKPPLDAHSNSALRYLETDVTNGDSVARAVNEAGAIRAAIICAGVIHAERITKDAPADLGAFRRVIEVNLIGTFNVLRLAAHAMRNNEPDAEGERGVIVTTSSVAAFDGQIGQTAYSASKGGVASITLPAARELGRFGIRVVSIAPGVFDTPMMQAVREDYRESLAAEIPFPHRFGRPEEFASLVVQAMENSMLNGEVIRLDGALRMSR